MKRKVKLNFGEKMREWRKARKEFQEEIKKKLREELEIKQNHPAQPTESEARSITYPTQQTEMKKDVPPLIQAPQNKIQEAINHLREQARNIQ